MVKLARKNHYVPQGYLRGWSQDGAHVSAYRLLVPRKSYPVWDLRPLRNVASQTDLYTTVLRGPESDAFERWLNQEVETPATIPLSKIREGRVPTSDEWPHLIRYVAALDQRTPAAYLDQIQRWQETLPDLLQKTVEESVRSVEAGRVPSDPPQHSHPPLPLSVEFTEEPDGQVGVRTFLKVGRDLWVGGIQSLLTSAVRHLTQHRWQILEPNAGSLWFTSDHPVLRLNWYGDGKYDFGGGWGREGSEIVVPLSPQHLLYTKVGADLPPTGRLDSDMTLTFQRLLAERAHRWIFALNRPCRPVWFRPRHVNREVFVHELNQWKQWHALQSGTTDNNLTDHTATDGAA